MEEEQIYYVRIDDQVRQYPQSRVRHIGPGLITVREGGVFDTVYDEWTTCAEEAQGWMG